MHYLVHIKPNGYNLNVKAGETVLAAAQRQGYQFPQNCDQGGCSTCKGKILEGHVEYHTAEPPNLSDEERESGFALFCSATPTTDLVIQIEGVIGPEQLPLKKLTYTVKKLEQLTSTIYHAILQPPENDYLQYHAGQYVEILHRDASPKPFSIANTPNSDHCLEFHIRYQPDNAYTAELLTEIQNTGRILVRGPFGNCILRHEPDYPILFVAGGTGFAPLKALMEQALEKNIQQPMYFYWGVRTTEDFYMAQLVESWMQKIPNFHFIPVLSGKSEQSNWQGRRGMVHEAVLQDHPFLAENHIYVSGPTEMVYATYHAFKTHGLDRSLLYSDAFDYPPA